MAVSAAWRYENELENGEKNGVDNGEQNGEQNPEQDFGQGLGAVAQYVEHPVVPAGWQVIAGSGRLRLGCCIARSGKLNRARSRLYRGQILQENMRLKALAEIYTMHSFAQL